MTDERVNHYRELLIGLRNELEHSLAADRDETAPVSPDRAIGRLTRQDAMLAQQMALELKRRNEARLGQVRRAVERIDDGEYGRCIRCDEDISEARLSVKPETPVCIRCAGSR